MKTKIKKYFPYVVIAGILVQTLFFKFTGHPESVALFTELNLLGMDESVGRLGTGIIELLVSIGLFIPALRKISLVGVIALMSGAVYFHITKLGFEGNNLPLAISAIIALVVALYLFVKKYKK